jgi:hypothetical protein
VMIAGFRLGAAPFGGNNEACFLRHN